MQRRTIHFSGRVQGVGFRYTVERAAAGRAIAGYVRNFPDGRVELVVEGSVPEIETLLADIRDRFANNISDVSTETAAATGEFDGFRIRH